MILTNMCILISYNVHEVMYNEYKYTSIKHNHIYICNHLTYVIINIPRENAADIMFDAGDIGMYETNSFADFLELRIW